jgi:hypothetical protein
LRYLVMGGIMVLSFGHWILWMRASTRLLRHPHQLV